LEAHKKPPTELLSFAPGAHFRPELVPSRVRAVSVQLNQGPAMHSEYIEQRNGGWPERAFRWTP